VTAIGDLLAHEAIIRSPLVFRIDAGVRGLSDKLQAGSFALSPSMDTDAVLDVLTGGKGLQMKLTIPEGLTVKDIDALVAEKHLAPAGAILSCAQTCDFSAFDFLPPAKGLATRGGRIEGYLFPDTYFVSVGDFVPKFFLERLLGTFRSRVADGLKNDIKASGRGLHQIVTMASLIEEETRGNAEKPVVAGILWKRFDAKTGLGVDATVRYILEKKSAALTAADLAINSPYNLRRFRGLPPGPIASAGLQSIKAALHPQQSPYWYYLHNASGVIHYAVTNDEHNANKARYLR